MIAGMTNSADVAEMPSQMAINKPISAWNLSYDAHQSSVLRISTLAVTNTPMPAEWRA